MKILIGEIQEILLKYNNEECDLEEKLNLGPVKQHMTEIDNAEDNDVTSKEEAKSRNSQLLKELETVKASLRSKAIYSPTEIHWKRISENYRTEPSLIVKKWRCYLPVYV